LGDHTGSPLPPAKNPETPSILFIPPLARPGSFNALANIVAHLRSPVGCPWDRAQTHQSLRKDFLEECYEVLETLDENDLPHLREELGDLMLHVLLQTQIAYQAGEFSLSEVMGEISEKLVRRHPHVFGDVVVNGTDEIIANWEKIKEKEKSGKHKAESSKHKSSLALPALMRAQKIAQKEKKRFWAKEIERLVAGLARAKKKQRALGEVLFALAAYAQEKHLDAETALREAVSRRRKSN
jgi:MazG family protein